MVAVTPPRGMRDFLPADKARRERVLAVIRERYRAHGFDEIETPVVEDYDRLHAGIGGDNEKLSFSLLRRGLDADQIRATADDPAGLSDLGLRYDLTVPLTRFYASHRGELPPVFRSIQVAPVWRAERPQKGRYRQFVQCDIDVIGDGTARAEIELIVATSDALTTLGLRGLSVRVNDRRLLDAMLDGFGFSADERAGVLITIDKLDKIGPSGVVAELRERGAGEAAVSAFGEYLSGMSGEHGALDRDGVASVLPPGTAPDVVDELAAIGAAVAEALGENAIPLVFDPFLVRGMGYYTGTIFEIAHTDVGYSLGGGGRYDGMVGRFLGQDVPAVGSSLGFERIVDLLVDDDSGDDDQIVLIHDKGMDPGALVALKTDLVSSGQRVRLEQRTKNTRAILDRAQRDGYSRYAFVGEGATVQSLSVRHLSDEPSN